MMKTLHPHHAMSFQTVSCVRWPCSTRLSSRWPSRAQVLWGGARIRRGYSTGAGSAAFPNPSGAAAASIITSGAKWRCSTSCCRFGLVLLFGGWSFYMEWWSHLWSWLCFFLRGLDDMMIKLCITLQISWKKILCSTLIQSVHMVGRWDV